MGHVRLGGLGFGVDKTIFFPPTFPYLIGGLVFLTLDDCFISWLLHWLQTGFGEHVFGGWLVATEANLTEIRPNARKLDKK